MAPRRVLSAPATVRSSPSTAACLDLPGSLLFCATAPNAAAAVAERPSSVQRWGLLPPPVVATAIDLCAADLIEACNLLAVCRGWRAHVWLSRSFQELFDRSARGLLTPAASRALGPFRPDVPKSFAIFLQKWVDVELRSALLAYGLPASAESSRTLLPTTASPEQRVSEEELSLGTMHAYIQMRRVCVSRDRAIKVARDLTQERLHLIRIADTLSTVNCCNLVLLAPQGALWLALQCDGLFECPVHVGSILGLLACALGYCSAGYSAYRTTCILRLRRQLRRCLGFTAWTRCCDAAETHLTRQEREIAELSHCLYWTCVLTAASAMLFLILLSSLDAVTMLPIGAALSCLPVVGAVISWSVHMRGAFDTSENRQIFYLHLSLSWLLAGLSIVCRTRGLWQIAVLLLTLLIPVGRSLVVIAALHRSRNWHRDFGLSEVDWTQLCIVFGLVLEAVVCLSVACGRCMGARWASLVPITALMVPLQLPLAICLLWFLGCAGSFVCRMAKMVWGPNRLFSVRQLCSAMLHMLHR